jgi:acetyl esterase/lipase
LGAVVFGVDYRLAPEHNIITVHDDAYQAVNWVLINSDTYSVDPSRVALWGCSAGGNIATGVAVRDAREHNPSRLVHVNLVVPALCHPDAFEGVIKEAVDLRLKKWAHLFPPGADPLKPMRDTYGE